MTIARVKIRPGPLAVRGPVVIVDADGHELMIPETEQVILCRCGQSAAKPFCDMSHERVGFASQPCLRDTEEGKSATATAR